MRRPDRVSGRQDMLRGWLVVNAYLTWPKFFELFDMLIKAAKDEDIDLTLKYGAQVLASYDMASFSKDIDIPERPDFIIYWDKDLNLARLLEDTGIRLYNRADAIAVCDDKIETYLRLRGSNIKMPKTYIAPKVYDPAGMNDLSFWYQVSEKLGYPYIAKEAHGSFGDQVYMIKSEADIKPISDHIGNREFLLQEYIESSKGRDIRIMMVGGQVVAAMERYNEEDFRANYRVGAKARCYTPTDREVEVAKEVVKRLGLDFAGIDLLFGKDEEPIFCEANSNAHYKRIRSTTGVDVGREIMRYIKNGINK